MCKIAHYSSEFVVTQYLHPTINFWVFVSFVRSFLLILGKNILFIHARILNADRFIVSLYLPLVRTNNPTFRYATYAR